MVEIYKPIPIEGLENYKVSNLGNVMNTKNKLSKKQLKNGYYYVWCKPTIDNVSSNHRIHRLVALAFIPNDNIEKIFVNHINGNKIDNNVTNLEWVTPTENVVHAVDTKLITPFARKMCQYDLNGNLLRTFDSLKEAKSITKVDDGSIIRVCNGSRKTAGGFIWRYQEKLEREVDDISKYEMHDIENFPDYKLTPDGKVYTITFKKFLKTRIRADGYEDLQLVYNKQKATFLMHRLVAMTLIPKTDEDIEKNRNYVNHKNGIKTDNRKENLEWATNGENINHYHKELKNKELKDKVQKL